MKFSLIKYTFCIITAVSLSSCSTQQPIASVNQPVRYSLPNDMDNLLPVPEIAFANLISHPVEFFTPELQISESFSKKETNIVRIQDEKLFEKRNELLIDFGQITEDSFSFPLPNARVISPYGTRRGRNHTGVDLKTYAKDTVRAAFDGIVRMAGKNRGYGNVIVIRHYNGLETVYSHNYQHMVKSGDRVKAGYPIALVGRTGRATTEHVHFEVRINGQYFDPNLIIDFQSQKLHNRCIVFTPSERGKIQIDKV